MSEHNYPPPVDKLLTYGDCRGTRHKWPNYLELGFTSAHIPDLIRMATDSELHWGDPASLQVWGPVHAWRTLAQLRAEAAVKPLLGILDELMENHDDWSLEEYPEVLERIGPVAIPALRAYLADDSHLPFSRICVADCLEHIGRAYPEFRNECVAILAGQLERFTENDPTLNGFLVGYLFDFKAVESAPIMQRAFEAQSVDESVAGDWEDAQVELGLKAAREKPRAIPPEIRQMRQALESFAARSRSYPKPASPQPRKKAHKRDKKQPAQRQRGNKRKK